MITTDTYLFVVVNIISLHLCSMNIVVAQQEKQVIY
jgi:hypothetical protein